MSTFIDNMIKQAKKVKKTIVLPEGNDERVLKAAQEVLDQDIANLIIIGDKNTIDSYGYHLDKAKIINPITSPDLESFASLLYELRKAKGMTLEEANELVKDPIYFAVMMVKTGKADGLVGGSGCATVKILSPALRVLKTAPDAPMVSSFFVMNIPDCEFGNNGTFLFTDCALCIQPTSEELAHIANAAGQWYKNLFDEEPNIALLSHSSYQSAKNNDSEKVMHAMEIIKDKYPDLNADGELQLDAAIIPEIAKSKAPNSNIAGKANVLVFPDLDAGNIGYKLVQRLANAEAYGPILAGLAAPVNDLSRGCTAKDIVGVIAITAVQAQNI